MKKNQIIIISVILVLIFGGIIGWALIQKGKIAPGPEVIPTATPEVKEIFSLSAKILSVDVENNFLIVRPEREEKEIKVILSEDTELIKLGYPFDPKNPPKDAIFTPTKTKIKTPDLKEGNHIYIETTENIYGKTEFNSVSLIQVLP